MKDKTIYRKGRLPDARQILKFLQETSELQGSSESKFYTIDFVAGALKNPDRDYVLIAENQEKIVGFLMAELWKYKKYSFLCEVFVNRKFRRMGVASKLFNIYLNYCKKEKIKFITSIALTSNKRIRDFNLKNGFHKGSKMYFYEKSIK